MTEILWWPRLQLSELFNSTFSHVLTILESLSKMFSNPTETTFDSHEMMSNLKTRGGVPGSDAAFLELPAQIR